MSEEVRQAKLIVSVEQRGADQTAASLRGVTQAGGGAEASFGNLALKIAGYTTATNLAVDAGKRVASTIVDLGKQSVVLAAGFEKSRVTWGVLVGDMAKGERVFEAIRSFAAETPLSFEALNQAATTVKGFGAANEEIIPILSRLGDIALGDNQKLQSLSLVYGQVMAQGKAKTQDLYQFINAGVPIFNLLATSMNVSAGEIKDLAAEGAITFEEIEKAITKATSEGGQFNGMMEQTAQTVQGKWSTAMDNANERLAKMGSTVLPIVNAALDAFNRNMNTLNSMENVKDVLAGKGTLEQAQAAAAYSRAELARLEGMKGFGRTDEEQYRLQQLREEIALLDRIVYQRARSEDAAKAAAPTSTTTSAASTPFEYGWHGLNYGMSRDIRGATAPQAPAVDSKYLSDLQRAQTLTQQYADKATDLRIEQDELNRLFEMGAISGDVYAAAMADVTDQLANLNPNQQAYNQSLDGMKNLMENSGIDLWVSSWQSLGAAMYEGQAGADMFAAAIGNLGQMILNQMPQLMFQAGIAAIANGQFWLGMSWILASGVVGAAGGYAKAATEDNALGGVYSSPSLHSYVNGVYTSPRIFNFARGAAMGRFAEAGPEAIMPLSRDSQGRLGVSGGMAKTNVTVNNYASNANVSVSEEEGPDGSKELVFAVENIVKSGMSNGRYRSNGIRPPTRRG